MRKKLLLADDSITIQKVVELTFPSDEFEVVTAGNGRLAVDKAMTFVPDIVLCDVIMPQLDGYQVCEALRAAPQLKNVPILLLNGAFEPYDADRAKTVGALGNVSKPFDPPALVARVKEILSERSTAAYERPTAPMTLDSIAEVAKAEEDRVATAAATAPPPAPVVALPSVSAPPVSLPPLPPPVPAAPAFVPPPPAPPEPQAPAPEAHAYTYDESETHPVSTVEVPMGVREMAARSLSLDAPVFSQPEPDVLTSPEVVAEDDPSHFSETLHGPLDEELPGAETVPLEAMETAMEAVEEVESVAATGEFEAPAELAAAAASAGAGTEPVDYNPAGDQEIRSTLPPNTVPASGLEEFSGEHEFEPDEVQAGVKNASATVGNPLPSAEVAVPVDMVQQIAQRVISQVSERVIREIAWDVIPGLADKLIKAEIERIKARAESERD